MGRLKGRERRRKILRKKIFGTGEKPRLVVYRGGKHFYAQLIDDIKGHTVFSLSTNVVDMRKAVGYGGNVKAARTLGEEFAKRAAKKGFGKVVFDRAGYLYHGRIKAFAEAVRKNGLTF